MILLGIVGTPASGKSTVASQLESKGARWINADLIARDVLTQADVIAALVDRFGDVILASDGAIDRAAMAGLVFGTTPEKVAALDFLESIVHPRTRQRIVQLIEQAASENVPVAILDIPLLFESKWDLACDAIWCVDAAKEKRVAWSAKRNWTADELSRRESNQLAIVEKRRLSNKFLANDATLAELSEMVDHLWSDLVTMMPVVTTPPDPGHCCSD